MSELLVSSETLRRYRRAAWLFVLLLTVMSIVIWIVLRSREDDDASRSRRDQTDAVVGRLNGGFEQVHLTLQSAAILLDSAGNLDETGFAAFAQVLLSSGAPNVVAFEAVVTDADRKAYEARTGRPIVDRAPDGTFVPAANRAVYYPVASVYPGPGNALGFDYAGDPARSDVMRLAQASGADVQMSPVITLLNNQPGFFIAQPLKSQDGRVKGFVTISYNGDAVGKSIIAGLPKGSRLRVSDQGTVLFESSPPPTRPLPKQLAFGGRSWTIDFDIPVGPSRTLSTTVLSIGLALSALAALTAALSHRHQRRIVTSHDRTARERDLAEVLALAVTSDEVVAIAAERIAGLSGARAVSVALLDGQSVRIQHSSSLDPVLSERWSVVPLAAETPISDAVRLRKPLIFHDTASITNRYPEVPLDPTHAASSLLCTPLVVGDSTIGALAFGFEQPQPFDAEQLRWLIQVTAWVAGAFERTRLYDQQKQVALALQRDLLPGDLPAYPSLQLSVTYRPAAAVAVVGGDWYDAFQLDDGRLALTIGDVAGSGVRAAASMGKVRHVLRACAGAYQEPTLVLWHANRLICRANTNVFATACYMTIDPSGRVAFALAGHPPPLHIGRDSVELVHSPAGAPLGVSAMADYKLTVFNLDVGESIALFTDGLFERPDEDIDRSLDRLVRVARTLGSELDANRMADTVRYAGRDDVVVLVAERVPVPAQVVEPAVSGADRAEYPAPVTATADGGAAGAAHGVHGGGASPR